MEETLRCIFPDLAEEILYAFEDPNRVLERIYPITHDLFGDEAGKVNLYGHFHDIYVKLMRAESSYNMDMRFLSALAES